MIGVIGLAIATLGAIVLVADARAVAKEKAENPDWRRPR